MKRLTHVFFHCSLSPSFLLHGILQYLTQEICPKQRDQESYVAAFHELYTEEAEEEMHFTVTFDWSNCVYMSSGM